VIDVENIRLIRFNKKLTQEDVAKRGKLKQSVVSEIETGKRKNPTHSTMQKLAAGLDVGLGELTKDEQIGGGKSDISP